eukprot:m.14826 g.14826  ORF g.14826 m.14826 type:complete len:513 (-) comp4832_c0_seq2:2371-3909(-)
MGSGRPFGLPGFGTVVTCATMATAASLAPMSVLHIVADDMRPELGAYGSPNAVTPNLDGLAAKSAVFVNAFCQQPICSPSRNSFMSGYRPQTIGVYNFINYFRQKFPNATSFPQFFKQQPGYLALGAGKLYHTSNPPDHDEPLSWSPEVNGSQSYFEPAWQFCAPPASTFCVNDSLAEIEDETTLSVCIGHLRRVAGAGKKGYVGCGFHRPHAPYIATSDAWSNHVDHPTTSPRHPLMAEGVTRLAQIVNFGIGLENGSHYKWDPETLAVPTDVALQVRKHYFAAITYVDGLVGQLLQELDTLGMAESTVVVFHSDHGYFQGESGEWEKKMLFENTARVPLIIHDPTHAVHIRVTTPVELIDVYPTAAALVLNTVPTEIDGVSVAALVRGSTLPSPKNYAFTAYPRCVQNRTSIAPPTCFQLDASRITFFGYSVRSLDWRYTEWRTWDGATLKADWTGPAVELELYNHTGHFADSERAFDFEQINRAADPTLADVRASLSAVLHAQFSPPGQ